MAASAPVLAIVPNLKLMDDVAHHVCELLALTWSLVRVCVHLHSADKRTVINVTLLPVSRSLDSSRKDDVASFRFSSCDSTNRKIFIWIDAEIFYICCGFRRP